MKKLAIALSLIFIFSTIGCGTLVTLKERSDNQRPCIDKTLYPESLILKEVQNPCQVYNVLASVAKAGIALDNYTYDDFHNKTSAWVSTLQLADSVSAKSIKDVIIAEILKINKRAGVVLFIASDTMLNFSDDVVFKSDDIKVLIEAIKGIDEQARLMASMM